MAILTTTELETHIETDLEDAALQRMLDATEEMIDREDGGTAAVTEVFSAWGFTSGRDQLIATARSISAITTIKERDSLEEDQTTLSADDYRQEGDRTLIRLTDGTNSRRWWAQHVEVIFTPVADTDIRVLVQIDLCKMFLANAGVKGEKIGDFDFRHYDTAAETKAILARLKTGKNRLLLV